MPEDYSGIFWPTSADHTDTICGPLLKLFCQLLVADVANLSYKFELVWFSVFDLTGGTGRTD